ncbi:MAG: hypothetical protein M0Z50_17050 [Planctomycetia bacterium]|nr:hypothetical protein [Planctomycetia bacterium]
MNIPYMIGRRITVQTPVSGLSVASQHTTSNLRAEDSGRTSLQTIGWSIATFGAGAVLGWTAFGNIRRRNGP